MDGFQIVEALRDSGRINDIPIVVLSVYNPIEDDLTRLPGSVTSILQKGAVDPREFAPHYQRTGRTPRREALMTTSSWVSNDPKECECPACC